MAPPIILIDVSEGEGGALDGTGDDLSFPVPERTQPGDSLIVVIAVTNEVAGIAADQEWETLATFVTPTVTALVLRRIAFSTDAATLEIILDAIPTWALAAMLVERNADSAAALVDANFDETAAATNFECPSLTAVQHSDKYIGIVVVSTALVAITNPAGTTDVFAVGDTGSLSIFELLVEATGATGMLLATTAANQSGLAGGVMLSAGPMRGGGKTLRDVSAIPGMIGLPSKGV